MLTGVLLLLVSERNAAQLQRCEKVNDLGVIIDSRSIISIRYDMMTLVVSRES